MSDANQYQLIQNLFRDELYYSAKQAATTYLDEFPTGEYREAVLFLRARSAELRSNPPKEVIDLYQKLIAEFPESQWFEVATMTSGYLYFVLEDYPSAISHLETLLQKSPQTEFRTQARYMAGKSAFTLAERALADKKMKEAQPLYQKTYEHLSKVSAPDALPKEQRVDRLYLLGTAAFQLKDSQNSVRWFQQYGKLSNDKEHLPTLYYQMGQQSWQEQRYSNALRFFEQLERYPQSTYATTALFSRAEVLYGLRLQAKAENQAKGNSDAITPPVEAPIKLYESYLKTKNTEYQATTHYRLGLLYQEANKPESAVRSYRSYLSTGEIAYAADAHYNMGMMFYQNDDASSAILELQRAQQSEKYENNAQIFQILSQLFEKTGRLEEQQELFATAKANEALAPKQRQVFQLKSVMLDLQNNRCARILVDLQELPETSNEEELHYYLYARGSCRVHGKQWVGATEDLTVLKNNPQYEKSVLDLLVVAYQELQQWQNLALLLEEFYLKDDFELRSDHFGSWANAYRQLTYWQQVANTYTRWDEKFPKDLRKPEILIDWAQVHEQLNSIELSKTKYEEALQEMPDSNLELRENIASHLADLYFADEDYWQVVRVYKKYLTPYLKDRNALKKYAFVLGQLYHHPLQRPDQARQWLKEADHGTNQDSDMEAGLLLSAVEENQKQPEQAIAVLNQLSERSLQDTKWYVPVMYHLGRIYDQEEKWAPASQQYRLVVAHTSVKTKQNKDLQQAAQNRLKELEKFLASNQLDQLIADKAWPQVTQLIRKEMKAGRFQPSNRLFETLVFAELEQKNWEGVLSAYERWSKFDASKTKNLDAIITQGQAAEELSKTKQARQFYEKAVNIVSSNDLDNRLFLTERLRAIYEKTKDYKSVVRLYEKTYPFLKKKEDKIQYAFTIGIYALSHLKQTKKAREWLAKTDQGGVTEEELNALWQLSELDRSKKPKEATRYLAKAAARPIAKSSQWYILLNYQLALLYHEQEQWQKAKIHYDRVAKMEAAPKYAQYQEAAKQNSTEITTYLKSLQEAKATDSNTQSQPSQ